MIREYNEKWYENIFHFVIENNLYRQFKKLFGVSIGKWEHQLSDTECIEELLSASKKEFIVFYEDLSEKIAVFEIKKRR